MTKFSVLILGNASASPTLSRNQTAQLININEEYFLMDCGEGTQLKLREHKIKIQRINHIFISHLHGDHCLGLMGLMQTMHLLGRQTTLNIYCCGDIEDIINTHLKHSKGNLGYIVNYKKVADDKPEIVFENKKIQVTSIPLIHKIPCTGFLFKEKTKPRKINVEAINKYNIPKFELNNIKLGKDYKTEDGNIIKNETLTINPQKSYSYAFCSDTAYNENIISQLEGVDLLYHEATFTEEHKDRAEKTNHSTAKQAATIALKSEVNELIIGHFSNRYSDLNELLVEAKSVFKNTKIAEQDFEFILSKPQ